MGRIKYRQMIVRQIQMIYPSLILKASGSLTYFHFDKCMCALDLCTETTEVARNPDHTLGLRQLWLCLLEASS